MMSSIHLGLPDSIRLLSRRTETEPYLDQVRRAADSERASFGFMPAAAYDDFSSQERMIVAVDASGALAGYTLYGGAMPQGRVFQTWTSPAHRKCGVGARLVKAVAQVLESAAYLSLRADVAADLVAANRFYGSLGFETIRIRPGRSVGRDLNIRVLELSTPSLLELTGERTSRHRLLRMDTIAQGRAPMYVLDVNVVFDVVKQRARAAAASSVMASAFENDIRLAISTEFISELERHSLAGQADPVLELAKALPRFPHPPVPVIAALQSKLAPVVFPDRHRDQKLTRQDISDLKHLCCAIHECAAGFITSEKAILRAGPDLKEVYGLDIVSPEAFSPSFDEDHTPFNSTRTVIGNTDIHIRPYADTDYAQVEQLLVSAKASSSDIRTFFAQGTQSRPKKRFIVRTGQSLCGAIAWEAHSRSTTHRVISLWVDENSSVASIAAGHLIIRAITDAPASEPTLFQVEISVSQPTVRLAAIANGFFQAEDVSPRSRAFTKLALGQAVIPSAWPHAISAIRKIIDIELPAHAPTFQSFVHAPLVEGGGRPSTMVSLAELERLVSPAIMALPGNPSVVLPIRQRYAEELFQGSAQPLLLSDREASLHAVRGYLSNANSYGVIKDGALAIFYESSPGGGRSAATAVARVSRRYLMDKDRAAQYASTRAVVDRRTISNMGRGVQVCVSEFDNLMLFRTPVPLHVLREIGCADGANFVTARAISTDHLIAILKLGQPNAVA